MSQSNLTDEQKEQLRSVYPKRSGNNWVQTRKLIDKHLYGGRATYEEILEGTRQYAGYIAGQEDKPRWRREFIKLAQTFYGPGQHWGAEYDAPVTPARESAPERIRRKAAEQDNVVLEVNDGRRANGIGRS